MWVAAGLRYRICHAGGHCRAAPSAWRAMQGADRLSLSGRRNLYRNGTVVGVGVAVNVGVAVPEGIGVNEGVGVGLGGGVVVGVGVSCSRTQLNAARARPARSKYSTRIECNPAGRLTVKL